MAGLKTGPSEPQGLKPVRESVSSRIPDHSKKSTLIPTEEEDPWAGLPKHLKNKKKTAYIRIHSDLKTPTPFSKLRLLFWKDWATLKRRWIHTLIEMFTPVLLVVILTIVVSFWPEELREASTYQSFGFQVPFHSFRNCTKFVFAPNVSIVKDVMKAVELEFSEGPKHHTFEMADGDESLQKMSQLDLCAGVVFMFKPTELLSELDTFPQHIHYKLRLPAVHRTITRKKRVMRWAGGVVERDALWQTSSIYPIRLITGPRNELDEHGGSPGYYEEGFLLLQNLVAEKIIHHIFVTGMSEVSSLEEAEDTFEDRMENIFMQLNRFPYPSNKDNSIVALLHDILPITIVGAYLIPFVFMVYGSVIEKESGIRIQMRSVGIPIQYHKSVWVFRCLLVHLPPAAIITAILATNWAKTKRESILTLTYPPVFFLVMGAYIFKTITLTMFIVAFFRRVSIAAPSAAFLWIGTYVPYYYAKSNYNSFNLWQRLLCCLMGNTGIALGFHVISEAEGHGRIVDFRYMFRGQFSTFSLGWIFCITIAMGLLELILANYVLKVIPEKGIAALPWNYCFKMWYWKNRPRPDEDARLPQHLLNTQTMEERFPAHFELYENVKRRKELTMEKVTKYFGAERTLNRFSLNCYEGDVTAIIGETGSGKSTLLKIIAGLIQPSSGQITVSRQDLAKNPKGANSFVGYCPGEDYLYPKLTVEETLAFYCSLKCTSGRLDQWNEVNRFLKEAMLEDYKDARVDQLTNSAKRMLLVACAFVGGSRVVLLDEPTNHMGAAQKRMTWEFISRQKRHRTVLVAMSCMNEGDSVVDKVVYLHHGEAVCNGTIRFIQRMFGGGYHLIVSKLHVRGHARSNVEGLRHIIAHRMGEAFLSKETPQMLDFFLPEEKVGVFAPMFDDIHRIKAILGVAEFHNIYRTMDEVLGNVRQIAMEADYDPEHRKAIYKGVEEVKIEANYGRLSGCSYHLSCFWALLLKNFRFLLRRKKYLILTTLAPVAFTVFCLTAIVLLPVGKNPAPLVLNFDNKAYTNPQALLTCVDAIHEGGFICDSLKSTFRTKFANVKVEKLINQTIPEYVLDHYKKYLLEEESPLVGLEVTQNLHHKRNVEMVGHFNNQPLHVAPVVVNIMDNALLEYMMDYLRLLHPAYVERRGFWNYSMTVTNEPLPYTAADHIKITGMFHSAGYFAGIAVSFGFAFLVSNFVVLHVTEKDFRHLQMVAGANSWAFWAANYLTNFLHFVVGATLVYFVFWAYSPGLKHFDGKDALTLYVLCLSYGLTSVFFVGAWSLLPNSDGKWALAYSRLLLFLILTGPLFMLFTLALSDPTLEAPQSLVTITDLGFLFFPSYALAKGIFYIFSNAVLRDECGQVEEFQGIGVCDEGPVKGEHTPWNEFDRVGGYEALWACCVNERGNSYDLLAYGVGQNMAAMLIVLFISFVIRVLKQSRIWTHIKRCVARWEMKHWKNRDPFKQEVHDYDVLFEMLRVEHTTLDDPGFIIKNLSKEVSGRKSVDKLCIRVDKGQCFCLLGVSGAGKTAALRMIVGSQMPTSGDARIQGHSLMKNYTKYIRKFGYCPAKSPFLDELTGQEVIQLIGTLRRIPSHILDGLITNLSLRLLFLHDLDNVVQTYSTNSVIKLSAAVSMIGDPEVVVMDEPTNFIDLISREYLFKCINNIVNQGNIVILSSKNVTECEPVCTNMAIMVNGHLRCFGSPDHLRGHFAEGFTVIVKFLLDPKKIFFTTRADQYKIRYHQNKDTKKVAPMKDVTERQYIDEKAGDDRLEAGEILLFADRASAVAEEAEEIHELEELTWEDDLIPFFTYFESKFPDAILVDMQPAFVHYHVRTNVGSASQLFETMEQARVFVSLIDTYYIGQANLDQVYLNFARGQRPTT